MPKQKKIEKCPKCDEPMTEVGAWWLCVDCFRKIAYIPESQKPKDGYKDIDKIILEKQEKRLAKQQKKIENWEKRFDEKYKDRIDWEFVISNNRPIEIGTEEIKSFIHQEKANYQKELREKIEKVKVPKSKYPKKFEGNELIYAAIDGHNQAIDRILNLLKEK